jgi:hypothetical protein
VGTPRLISRHTAALLASEQLVQSRDEFRRRVRTDGHTLQGARRRSRETWPAVVERDVVPKHDIADRPIVLVAIGMVIEHGEQFAEQCVAFRTRDADDVVGVKLVGEDDLCAGARVRAENGLPATR